MKVTNTKNGKSVEATIEIINGVEYINLGLGRDWEGKEYTQYDTRENLRNIHSCVFSDEAKEEVKEIRTGKAIKKELCEKLGAVATINGNMRNTVRGTDLQVEQCTKYGITIFCANRDMTEERAAKIAKIVSEVTGIDNVDYKTKPMHDGSNWGVEIELVKGKWYW